MTNARFDIPFEDARGTGVHESRKCLCAYINSMWIACELVVGKSDEIGARTHSRRLARGSRATSLAANGIFRRRWSATSPAQPARSYSQNAIRYSLSSPVRGRMGAVFHICAKLSVGWYPWVMSGLSKLLCLLYCGSDKAASSAAESSNGKGKHDFPCALMQAQKRNKSHAGVRCLPY